MNEKEIETMAVSEDVEKLVEKPSRSKKNHFLLSIFAFVFLAISVIGVYVYTYIETFSNQAGIEKLELLQQVKTGLQASQVEKTPINILILGVDQIGNHRKESLLTDTVLISSISPTGKVALISFPRDLWINPLLTKINALYYYGEKSEAVSGVQLASTTMQEVSGLPINHHLILNLDMLKKIINILGGISIQVDEAFVDEKYPRDDVSPDILPIESRYKTISFQKGTQDMNGEVAIEFIRSRQSTNLDENTDNARSKRQQKILLALISKIQSKDVITNPELLGSLFALWQEEVDTSLSVSQIVQIARKVVGSEMSFQTINIPIKDNASQGILFNPPLQKYKQWVYEPYDPSWQELHEYIQKNLN